MSAILSADDLNDFISPGVACIKPVESKKSSNNPTHAKIEISMEGVPTEVTTDGQKTTLEKAQISLSDCLACSGCITSAESVFVSLQSHDELLSSLRRSSSKNKTFVASISHQVRVSLASAYGISIEKVDAKLHNLLIKRLGFKYVVGLEVGRVISLAESLREVRQRRAEKSINNDQTNTNINNNPVLCSSCPGWTCYAEKTHPHIIPYLSSVKSPQQITGTLIKELISTETGLEKDQIYHLSIMPCFDKKLEAARPEFGQKENEDNQEFRDVDCVITAKEVVLLLLSEGIDFESLNDTWDFSDKTYVPKLWPVEEQWQSHIGSSSGGYLDYILAGIQSEIQAPTHIQVINGKNSDVSELRIVTDGNESEIHFRAARIYGFRNIQNLVRKLKGKDGGKKIGISGGPSIKTRVSLRNTARPGVSSRLSNRRANAANGDGDIPMSDPSQLDYVEVMACPGGCINGGGQIGIPEKKNPKEWRQELEYLYQSIPQISGEDGWAVSVENLSKKWLSDLWKPSKNLFLNETTSDYSLLSVEYHAIDDLMNKSTLSGSANSSGSNSNAALALGAKW